MRLVVNCNAIFSFNFGICPVQGELAAADWKSNLPAILDRERSTLRE